MMATIINGRDSLFREMRCSQSWGGELSLPDERRACVSLDFILGGSRILNTIVEKDNIFVAEVAGAGGVFAERKLTLTPSGSRLSYDRQSTIRGVTMYSRFKGEEVASFILGNDTSLAFRLNLCVLLSSPASSEGQGPLAW